MSTGSHPSQSCSTRDPLAMALNHSSMLFSRMALILLIAANGIYLAEERTFDTFLLKLLIITRKVYSIVCHTHIYVI